MFILRKQFANCEQNIDLGDSYDLVRKESNKKEFERLMSTWESGDNKWETIYAFIVYSHGSEIFPLHVGFNYYVMYSDGKTFENITFK